MLIVRGAAVSNWQAISIYDTVAILVTQVLCHIEITIRSARLGIYLNIPVLTEK